MSSTNQSRIVIVGGGTAGITVAAQLRKKWKTAAITIIEPADTHYYQPLWTLVGAGAATREQTARPMSSVIPAGCQWVRDHVVSFNPEQNELRVGSGESLQYDYLIVAAGIQVDWDRVPGLKETIGHNGVCSNYSYETVNSTWEAIRNFKGGTAVFTQPAGAIKCGGAPQKICYLAEDYFRRQGIRDQCEVIFTAAGAAIFAVDKYRVVLEQVVERKGIKTLFRHNLVEIDGPGHTATFQHMDTGERVTQHFDMIHVTPPMSAPEFIRNSPLADDGGWVDVDQSTLQHVRYPNVFSAGDASSLPTSKTGAAVRKQAPVLVDNLIALHKGQPLKAGYDGYTSCPVVTGYGRMVLAEFDYDKQPAESFPFNQAKERWSMWLLKKYGLPLLYWQGMLKGRA